MSRLSSPKPPSRTPSPARSLSPDAPPTMQGQLLSAQRTSDLYDTSEDEAELQGLSGSSAEVSPCVSPAPPKIVDFVPKKIQFVQADTQGEWNTRPSEAGVSNAPAIVVSDPDATEAILGGRQEGSSGTLKMATQRPKSPRPSPKKEEGNESFWDKFGTLGRKKKIKEVQEVQTEGKYAIDSPGAPMAVDIPPDDYNLDDNEERSMIEPRSYEDPKLKELIAILIEWINDELANDRIIVKHIEEDLYDGMVFHKLIEKLTNNTLDVQEVTQSEEGQKQKLRIVLNAANHILGLSRYGPHKWSVESIHSKNIVAILHLLVSLARHFRAPIRLPENCIINVVIVQKRDGQLNHRIVTEELTGTYDDLGLRCERDAFDTLFDHAPDKLAVVKRSLVTFVNKQLNKINLEVSDIETEFNDGVYLCLLMGLLEGYFVPLHHFFLTPKTFDEKLHNVSQSFELMMDAGLAKPKARPEDIVNADLKSTLRVLYNLFTRYKNTN
ncbi:beta-parvin-like [Penaeus japonicus]|uniref:beta-parvin-like n=1 Tax=Penaeus japonicus TaxID=27405 RepID=UPI001C710C33|nr:beta-parvin-like [Penaeus japonicus]XP_042887986.1 beta-parvin-like [Penaeus japonicus]XP_042887987.1 beta-parvin-like [Penaeus japonicus]XP_042887988.1 beta-parvin-like [Penaeus japonicus]